MSKVIPIDSLRQHIVVNTPEKTHVIPAIWFDRFVDGAVSLDTIDDHEEIMRSIVSCWLASLRKTH